MPTNTKNNAAELGLGHPIASVPAKPACGANPATHDPSAAVAQSEAPIATTLTGSNCGVRFARFTSSTGLLTKTVSLLPGGALDKKTDAYLISGIVENITLDSFDAFGDLLTTLEHNQALAYGVSLRGDGPVMSEDQWDAAGRPTKVLLRNREHFDWPTGSGVLMLDYDPPKNEKALTREELLAVPYDICPELKAAAHFWWPSASSCIYDATTGEELVGVRGQRVYVLVDDARQIPRIGKRLEALMWLAKRGRFEVSKGSRLLPRTLVDGLVWQPERLDFAAGSKCAPPLEQRRPAPLRLGGPAPLDTLALRDLTESDSHQVKRAKAAARSAMEPEAARMGEECIQKKSRGLQQTRGLDEKTATAVARDAYQRGRLMGDFELVSRDGKRVSVKDLLDEPDLWHGERFHDPLDEDCEDERIAWFNAFSGGRPYLYSHAHGGTRYELHRAVETVSVPNGGMRLATERTLEVMRASGTYYDRANALVVVTADGDVKPLEPHALMHWLDRDIAYEKFDGKMQKMKRIDCPEKIALRTLALRGERGLPNLSGVQLFPTMTPKGRLIERPGYDEETGLLLLNLRAQPWPRIPGRPSNEEVLAALERLWFAVSLFPYIDETSRAITLAALLTAVVRRTLLTAPAFMFVAPSAGTGKTLLARCPLELAGPTATTTLPDSDVEMDKTLIAHLRKAPAALFFDNVVGAVDSKILNAMLTAEIYEGRILGKSETSGPLPTNLLVVITGNNAHPAGDTCRRILVSTIDPRMEAPYKREFDFNPVDQIRGQRMELIVDALTILRGWIASGLQRVAPGNLASFEAWDALVRQAVVWVGQLERKFRGGAAIGFGDPIANIQHQFAEDDETESLGNVLSIWKPIPDGQSFKADELCRQLDNARRGGGGVTELGLALLAAMPQAKDPRAVSGWLRRMKGRIVKGLRIEGMRDSAENLTLWCVRRLAA